MSWWLLGLALLGCVVYWVARYQVPSPINVRWRTGGTSGPTEPEDASRDSQSKVLLAHAVGNVDLDFYRDPGAGYWSTEHSKRSHFVPRSSELFAIRPVGVDMEGSGHEGRPNRTSKQNVLLEVRIQKVVDSHNTQRLRVASVVVDGQEMLPPNHLLSQEAGFRRPGQTNARSLPRQGAAKGSARSNQLYLPSDGVPTRGLLIQPEPLDKILKGRKTLELRSAHNRQLGTIALIRKGSKQIEGVADIVESIGPMDEQEMHRRCSDHGVEPHRIPDMMAKGWTIGWRLVNVKRLVRPVPYVHRGMSRVNLDEQAIVELRQALPSALLVQPGAPWSR